MGLAGVVRWVRRRSVVAGAVLVAVVAYAEVQRLPMPAIPQAEAFFADASRPTDPRARVTVYAGFVARYLPDPSFESDPEIDVPPSLRWRKMWEPNGPGTVTWDTQMARSGNASMRIENTYFGADRYTSAGIRGPLLPVITGPDVLKFSGWVRTENATGLTLLAINWLDANETRVKLTKGRVRLAGTRDWTELVIIDMPPEGAQYAQLEMRSIENIGIAWLDDVEVVLLEGETAELHLVRGSEHEQAERYAEAVPEYEAAVAASDDPHNQVEALLGIGRCHLRQRKFDLAARTFDRLIAAVPDPDTLANATYWKADCYRYGPDFGRAIELYKEALKLDPAVAHWRRIARAHLVLASYRGRQYEDCVAAARGYMQEYGAYAQDHESLWEQGYGVLSFGVRAFERLGRSGEGEQWVKELERTLGGEESILLLLLRGRGRVPRDRAPSSEELASLRRLLQPAYRGAYGASGRMMACLRMGEAHLRAGDIDAAGQLFSEGARLYEEQSAWGEERTAPLQQRWGESLQQQAATIEFLKRHPIWIAGSTRTRRIRLGPLQARMRTTALRGRTIRGRGLRMTLDLQALRVAGEAPQLEVSCDDAAISGTVRRAADNAAPRFAARYTIDVEVSPEAALHNIECELAVTSASFGGYELEIPVEITVRPLLRVHPESLFFGFVKPSETKTLAVGVIGAVAFQITATKVDKPELVTVRLRRQNGNSYLIETTLRAPANPTVVEGTIELSTSLASQRSVIVPYYAHVGS